MKKTVLLLALGFLFASASFAQDTTTNSSASKPHHMTTHKKGMHNNKMPVDSVNAGKITTNPNGKTDDRSSSATMKTHKKAMNSSRGSSKDSAR